MLGLDEIGETAKRLSGKDVNVLCVARPGGNNRIFRIDAHDGQSYALKFYPSQDEDRRDRLGAEWEAINFMAANGINPIPKPMAIDATKFCALYEWVSGCKPDATADNILMVAHFLKSLQKLYVLPGAKKIRNASAACFSASAVVDQLYVRRYRLNKACETEPELKTFLSGELDLVILARIEDAKNGYAYNGWDFKTDISVKKRCLSPSDVGLHNAIMSEAGNLTFIDFEYFGWDDPVKAVCDVVLHPGSSFSKNLCQVFLDQMVPEFSFNDTDFLSRLKLLYPLYACIWCLIILNEFLPEHWARRTLAGSDVNHYAIKKNQLIKSQRLLSSIESNHNVAYYVP